MINTAGLGVLPPAASLANVPLIGQGATLGHQRAGSGVPVTVAGAQVEAGSAGGGSGCRGLPAGGLTVTHPALASISGLHVGEGAAPVPALTSGPGVYVGEGAAPVPKKLADKILRWEFACRDGRAAPGVLALRKG